MMCDMKKGGYTVLMWIKLGIKQSMSNSPGNSVMHSFTRLHPYLS